MIANENVIGGAAANGFMLGLSGAEGLTLGEHTESYVSSYELVGSDYRDGYIHKQLEAHGFKSPRAPKAKRVRPGTLKKRTRPRRKTRMRWVHKRRKLRKIR